MWYHPNITNGAKIQVDQHNRHDKYYKQIHQKGGIPGFFGLKHSSTFSCNSWLGTRVFFSRIVHGSVATDRAHVSCQSWFPLSDSFRFIKHHENMHDMGQAARATFPVTSSNDLPRFVNAFRYLNIQVLQNLIHIHIFSTYLSPPLWGTPMPTARLMMGRFQKADSKNCKHLNCPSTQTQVSYGPLKDPALWTKSTAALRSTGYKGK